MNSMEMLKTNAPVYLFCYQGRTALDAAEATLKGNAGEDDDEYTKGRKKVVKFLRQCLAQGDGSGIRRRNVIHDEDNEQEDKEDTASSTLQRFNEKLKKKEQERLRRMNKNLCEENSPEDLEICPTKRLSQQQVFVNADEDDSQEGCSMFSISTNPYSGIESSSYSDRPVDHPSNSQYSYRDHGEGIQTFSDGSDYEGHDFVQVDCPYASSDSENTVEMATVADENNGNTFNSSYVDPVTGVRISCPTSGLLPERTAAWLVDDVGPKPAKRKRPAKQTKLTGGSTVQRRSTAAMPRPGLNHKKSKPTTISRRSPGLSLSRPKQAKLPVSKEPRTRQTAFSSHSMVNNASSPVTARSDVNITNVTTGTPRTYSPDIPSRLGLLQAGTPPMRLRVRVQDKVFLIPCPRSNHQESKNIGWLAQQVVNVSVVLFSSCHNIEGDYKTHREFHFFRGK